MNNTADCIFNNIACVINQFICIIVRGVIKGAVSSLLFAPFLNTPLILSNTVYVFRGHKFGQGYWQSQLRSQTILLTSRSLSAASIKRRGGRRRQGRLVSLWVGGWTSGCVSTIVMETPVCGNQSKHDRSECSDSRWLQPGHSSSQQRGQWTTC